MAQVSRYVEQGFRALAVVGAVAAVGGALAMVAGFLEGLSRQGVDVYVELPLSRQQAETLIVGGFAAFVSGAAVNILGNTVANFVAGFRTPPESTAGRQAESGRVPASERACRRLQTAYLLNGGTMAVFTVVGLLGPSALGDVGLLASLVLKVLFGSVAGGVLITAVFAALWYGVRIRATEALIGGFVFGIVFLLFAVSILSVGFAIFAVVIGYYSLRARGGTQFRVVDANAVPGGLRRTFE